MRYIVIGHKHGSDVYFAATEEALWTEIAECFDEEDVRILRGEEEAPGDGPFIDHHDDVPEDPRIATMLEALRDASWFLGQNPRAGKGIATVALKVNQAIAAAEKK